MVTVGLRPSYLTNVKNLFEEYQSAMVLNQQGIGTDIQRRYEEILRLSEIEAAKNTIERFVKANPAFDIPEAKKMLAETLLRKPSGRLTYNLETDEVGIIWDITY